MRSFGSDNHSGVHPAVLAALAGANQGHAPAYGADDVTARAAELVRRRFGPSARFYPALTGTGANVLALTAACRRWEAVVCAESAHIANDECGAPEAMAGVKLLTVPHRDGKVTPELLAPRLGDPNFEHRNRVRAVSISQPTELGAVYTVAETRALADFCRAHGLVLHMDGARLANAAAHLGADLGGLTTDAGVDILSFGGTKNGLLAAEAVVFLQPGVQDDDFKRIRKQSMQLASKMRFFSAQFCAYLEGGLWLDNARHANAMAALLAAEAAALPGVGITRPVQTNAVFAAVPPAALAVREQFPFYVWNPHHEPGRPEVRWMTSFDTTPDDVMAFAAALRRALGA